MIRVCILKQTVVVRRQGSERVVTGRPILASSSRQDSRWFRIGMLSLALPLLEDALQRTRGKSQQAAKNPKINIPVSSLHNWFSMSLGHAVPECLRLAGQTVEVSDLAEAWLRLEAG